MYFKFMENSTETILETPLFLCALQSDNEIMGSDREVLKGETGIYRVSANEYGAKYSDVLTFEYALIKKNETPFTELEQRKIERWLTSPKNPQWLQLFDCQGFKKTFYFGTFISTKWKKSVQGLTSILFTFQCNSPYAWQQHSLHYENIAGTQDIYFNIYSDELEEFVYPSLRIFAAQNSIGRVNVTMKNITDGNNQMTISTSNKLAMYLDCESGHFWDDTPSGMVDFSDIGWTDAGDIYLPRFYPGENHLEITVTDGATLELDITYMSSMKKVGGWL